MPVTALIFDFDGVVIDSEPLYVAAEKRLFARYNVTVPDEDWKYFKGTTDNDFYRIIKNKYDLPADYDELKKYGRQFIKEEFQKGIDYFPGFTDFWRCIEGRYRTALVTSTSATFLRWIFHNTRVRNHFDLTITAEDVNQAKPHPEPYLNAMRRLGVIPAETVVIEDSINGVKSAVAAGALTIGFLSSLPAVDLPEAHFHTASYDGIEAILRNLAEDDVMKITVY